MTRRFWAIAAPVAAMTATLLILLALHLLAPSGRPASDGGVGPAAVGLGR